MDLNQVTQDTLELVKKAQTNGILTSTGIYGYDLSGLVSQVPVNVPARNNTSAFPRVIAGMGSEAAVWRALLNVNAQQTDTAIGFDYAGSLAKISEIDVFAAYKPMAKAGRVTLDAVALGRNYADVLASDTLQTLIQLFLGQDMHIINSQGWGLGRPSKPALTTATEGGSITKGKELIVKVAARSGANYFAATEVEEELVAGATEVSEAEEIKVGAGSEVNTVGASHAAIKGAVAYDWYVGEKGGKLWYYTTTSVAKVVITSIPTKAEALPTNLPLLSAGAPAPEGQTEDLSSSVNWYNGIIASNLGDYGPTGPVKPGEGTPSGATFIDFGGAKISASGASIGLLDQINDALWASVQLSPTAYMVNSLQADEISDLILGSSAAVTFLPPTDADARTNLAGGGYVGRYINKAAGGVPVSIEVHPRVAPGTIITRTDRVPFPGSNIGSVYEVRCQIDTMQFDYAASYQPGQLGGGPRQDFEIRSIETLVNRAPVAQCIATNVG